MATDETKEAAATLEQPLSESVTEEETKPVKEKKPRAPREKKPKQPKTASHPPYFQMIKEALLAMNEKSGSSPYAIAKYMEEKHKAVLPENFKKILGLQLKNSAARGKLIKIKASYKLSEAGKKEIKQTGKMAKAASDQVENKKKKQKKARVIPTRKTRSVNNNSNKKTESGAKKAKKSTSGKPKQPKSIKSPAARRSRRSAAVVASAS